MLNYETIDNNKDTWIVFVHGLGGSIKTWKKQKDYFSKEYNLLLIDLPGHGEDSNKCIEKIDNDGLCYEIKSLMDDLGITSANFIGLSLGTIVIMNFILKYPSYAKKIIFGGPALLLKGCLRWVCPFMSGIKNIVSQKFLCKSFAWFMIPKRNHKKSRLFMVRESVKMNKKTLCAWIEYTISNLRQNYSMDKFKQIKKQILMISGDKDHCFFQGDRIIAEKIKGFKLKVIKNCGHVCTLEKAKDFNELAMAYLQACPA